GRIAGPGDRTAPTGLAESADQVVIDQRGVASTGTVTKIDLGALRVAATLGVELHPTALAWDGVLCPFECGGAIEKKTQMVSDVIELEEAKAGAVMVRNRAPVAKRTIPFSDLKSQNSAFED
ncbi:MAG: hypothetical protein AAB250_12225, partial [Bdellovibrionota bacterium]